MKINKIVSLPVLVFALSALAGCGPKTHAVVHGDFIKHDNYLYQIHYDDYDWEKAAEYVSAHPRNTGKGFGCSAVRRGNFYGRSFDFDYNEMAEFVIDNSNTAAKYKNIGVAIGNCSITKTMIEDGLDEGLYAALPYTLVDGINEKGVVCNTNVVPVRDIETKTTGTNEGKKDVFYQFLPRFVLDNAASAKEAVDLIKNEINVTNKYGDFFGLDHAGFELHLMVADKDDTFIVEFVNNKVRVVENYVMTNYYLSLPYTYHSCGIERFDILSQFYNEATSAQGMAHLMERVRYSQSAKVGATLDDNVHWYSEFTSDEMGYWDVVDAFQNRSEDIADCLRASYEIYARGDRSGYSYTKTVSKQGDPFSVLIKAPWQSVHMDVYDIEMRTMRLVIQEDYETVYNFSLN